MRRGFGSVFTTTVALIGATVVVANPVTAPASDVRVPAVTLSAGSTASPAALDRALLDVLAQDHPETRPVELVKRSLAGVVADVALFGGQAVEGAITRPVVEPRPVPAPPPLSSPSSRSVANLLSGTPPTTPAVHVAPTAIENPALAQAVTSVADYVGYVSVQAVDATAAAGTIGAAGPQYIADTLVALTHGDVDTAITTALRTAAAPLRPPSAVVTAIRTEVRKQLTELADRLRRSVPPPPRVWRIPRPATAERAPSLRVTLGHRRNTTATATPAAPTPSADRADAEPAKPTAVNGATDLTDGNKAVPRAKAPQAALRQRTVAPLNQVRDSLQRLGDTLRKAVTPHRPHRTHRH
ncbi:hypothetical protein [Mycobacterium sp. shizuoka-1]|uniref:hypothetical protein n=1 Tax=Mycobacterium sp. shizuoka-1 TaxID=2039281 RepID=UPI000C0631A2|nr:hypothetical protein [Mycobacterium sp. shizuoka-1]GAY17335.1 hypothetical protein MSZK_40610 [Mycobacterium sp. shizuoka-1]